MVEFFKVDFEEQKLGKNNKGIYIIKNKTLLAPGEWNGKLYSSDEIIKSFKNTDWKDKDVVSLIADHRDDDKKGRPLTIRDWVGFISNQYVNEEGFLIGDLNICDSDLAVKLENGAPFGISPFLGGMEDNGKMKDFFYKNFAIVVEPACKESFINLSDDELSIKLEDITAFERIRKRTGMSVSEFYAAPRDPPSNSKLPIFDKAHTQNAMARFNQTQFSSESEKSKAKSKIISAAKKFGIEIKEFDKLGETSQGDMSGSSVSSKGLQPIKIKKKKKSQSSVRGVQSIQLKGGNKMAENEEEKEEVEEEAKEEEEEKPSEEAKEESKEEVKEVEVEMSEEDLLGEIAKLCEKYLSKKKLSPQEKKMQDMESEIVSLKNELKKLGEIKAKEVTEKKEEVTKEKLSAKPRTIAKTMTSGNNFTFGGNKSFAGSQEFAAMMGY